MLTQTFTRPTQPPVTYGTREEAERPYRDADHFLSCFFDENEPISLWSEPAKNSQVSVSNSKPYPIFPNRAALYAGFLDELLDLSESGRNVTLSSFTGGFNGERKFYKFWQSRISDLASLAAFPTPTAVLKTPSGLLALWAVEREHQAMDEADHQRVCRALSFTFAGDELAFENETEALAVEYPTIPLPTPFVQNSFDADTGQLIAEPVELVSLNPSLKFSPETLLSGLAAPVLA